MTEFTAQEIEALRDELSKAQIRDSLMRYCRGVDRADLAMFLSAFHPGAREDHGQYHGEVEEFAKLTTDRIPSTLGIQHFLGNMLVELDGDAARVETYFMATYRPRASSETLVVIGGRYLDRFERRDGGPWLIAKRYVVNDWSSQAVMPENVAGMAGYPTSRSDSGDPVFDPATWQAHLAG